jgi:hypothetical protein
MKEFFWLGATLGATSRFLFSTHNAINTIRPVFDRRIAYHLESITYGSSFSNTLQCVPIFVPTLYREWAHNAVKL